MDVGSLLTVQLPTLLVVIIGVPAVLAGYIVGFEFLVRRLPDRAQPAVRPWIWVAPSLVFVALFLVYPSIDTVRYSLLDNHGAFVGFGNYSAILTDPSVLVAIRNNVYWLVLYTGLVPGANPIFSTKRAANCNPPPQTQFAKKPCSLV